jgi:hypothetical protein
MASENKTKPTDDDVEAFLAGVEPPRRREDSLAVLELMKRVTGWEPRMWGPSIVGFGQYHYRYDSGREGDSLRVGFSPRKASLVLYIMPGFGRYEDLMSRLGKHKTGKSCLYVNKLADVDLAVLEQLVVASLEHMAAKYPQGA